MSELRVTHVVADLAKSQGGPSYSVPRLAASVAELGADTSVRSVGAATEQIAEGSDGKRSTYPLARGPLAAILKSSPALYAALRREANAGAALHTHGLWLMPNIYPAWAKRRTGGTAKLIHSPRGMLSEEALKISSWKKKPFWILLQRSALEAADCLHATAYSEYEEIRAQGLRAPVAVIPNGVDLPSPDDSPAAVSPRRTVLSLGRLHPKKGLSNLVRAWAPLEESHPEWQLRVVGPAEAGHDEELRRLAANLGARRVSIEAALYGEQRLHAFRASDVFVLPTLNENFGMVVAEALAANVPVICTKGAPWSGLDTNACGWWIDHGIESLAAALEHAMRMPRAELRSMGQRGRVWMARDFSWERVGRDMMDVYRWLKNDGEPPAALVFD